MTQISVTNKVSTKVSCVCWRDGLMPPIYLSIIKEILFSKLWQSSEVQQETLPRRIKHTLYNAHNEDIYYLNSILVLNFSFNWSGNSFLHFIQRTNMFWYSNCLISFKVCQYQIYTFFATDLKTTTIHFLFKIVLNFKHI